MIVIKIAIMSHRKVLFYIESAIVMYLKKYFINFFIFFISTLGGKESIHIFAPSFERKVD